MVTYLARMDAATFIVWILVFGAVISVIYFLSTLAVKGKKSKRIKAVISRHRGELGVAQAESLNKSSSVRNRKTETHVELAQKVVALLNLQKFLSSSDLRNDLARAGMRGRSAVTVFIASRLLGITVGFLLVLFYVNVMKKFPYPDFMKLVFAGGGALVGFYLPKILLSNKIQNRQSQMTLSFPDALDLLLICVESGLGVEMAFSKVTEEILESAPVLAQELGLTSAELAYLGDRRVAYENFSNRTGLPAAKALATTLIQSEQYGTPVGVALKVLAQEKRDERLSASEKKAAALPAKLTVPMIIFFLPVIFIVVIGPAAMQIG
jgi:tight adherence protein C